MFSLTLERGRFLRIRKGVTDKEVSSVFGCPSPKVFCGEIIKLSPPKRYCYARVGDTYETVSKREGVDETRLRAENGGRALYPTLKIWLP